MTVARSDVSLSVLLTGLVPLLCASCLAAGSSFSVPFTPDKHTLALYHFDEGEGNETHDACGDPVLTLRAHKQALWGERPGFGATARFERIEDDANVIVGPLYTR